MSRHSNRRYRVLCVFRRRLWGYNAQAVDVEASKHLHCCWIAAVEEEAGLEAGNYSLPWAVEVARIVALRSADLNADHSAAAA